MFSTPNFRVHQPSNENARSLTVHKKANLNAGNPAIRRALGDRSVNTPFKALPTKDKDNARISDQKSNSTMQKVVANAVEEPKCDLPCICSQQHYYDNDTYEDILPLSTKKMLDELFEYRMEVITPPPVFKFDDFNPDIPIEFNDSLDNSLYSEDSFPEN